MSFVPATNSGWLRLRDRQAKPLLISSFLLVCAVMLGVGGIGMWGMMQLNTNTTIVPVQPYP